MISGYYKYIVFGYPHLQERTGQVFGQGDLGPEIEGIAASVPNSYWIAETINVRLSITAGSTRQKEAGEIAKLLLGDGNVPSMVAEADNV